MWYERTKYKHRLLHSRNHQIQVSYFLKHIELLGHHLHQQLIKLKEIKENVNDKEKKPYEEQSIPKIIPQIKSQTTLAMNAKRRVAILCEYYDKVYHEYLIKKNKKIIEEPKKETIIDIPSPRPSTAPSISNNIPQAPPYPPPEFFQQTSSVNEVRTFKRQKSAPATVTTPIEELKQIFAGRSYKIFFFVIKVFI